MRDQNDTQTVDAFAIFPRPGRPRTGKALSAAERKRQQRARERELCERLVHGEGVMYADLSTRALTECLARLVQQAETDLDALPSGAYGIVAGISDELQTRFHRKWFSQWGAGTE